MRIATLPRTLLSPRRFQIPRPQNIIEALVCDVLRPFVENLSVLDGIHRESSQAVAQVTPGIEVPVVSVMDEALQETSRSVTSSVPRAW